MPKKLSRHVLYTAIITLITVLTWVGFTIYRAYTKTAVSPDVRKQLAPINPKLDTKIIDNLKSRRHISLEEIRNFSFKSPPSEIIEEQETETEATESGTKETEPEPEEPEPETNETS